MSTSEETSIEEDQEWEEVLHGKKKVINFVFTHFWN
jgi:hypothetical protein